MPVKMRRIVLLIEVSRRDRPARRLIELAAGRYSWTSPWLRACALRGLEPLSPSADAVLTAAASDRNQLIAETAQQLLRGQKNTGGDGGAGVSLSIFDRVLKLKKVSIFSDIPYEVLANVASILRARVVSVDETLINKGDRGGNLYIIAAGRVRVHDNGRSLREMGQDEFFGELSLLDSQPRTASVSAVEPTTVLELTQDIFYALTQEQPEITRVINSALCQRIRQAYSENTLRMTTSQ